MLNFLNSMHSKCPATCIDKATDIQIEGGAKVIPIDTW